VNDAKYIGLDVHQATISAAVLDSAGKLVMEAILETKAATILQFIHGLRGDLQVTFEEGTCAAWLHDLLKPHVRQVSVCDPRKNALLKVGNKSDRIDARKLAELLRANLLRSVYGVAHFQFLSQNEFDRIPPHWRSSSLRHSQTSAEPRLPQ
jgi:transposase